MRARGAALLAFLIAPASAEWVSVRSAQIEVLTDSGEKAGRAVLARLEQIRRIFRDANMAESALGLRVFVFTSEKEFSAYASTATTKGFYQSGPERDYIALCGGGSTERLAAHEYVHFVLNHSFRPLPVWFEEGTAEFYSTLNFERDRLRVGDSIESHLALLRKEPWLTADQLASVTQASPLYNEAARIGVFYAQSWALVHMLNLGPAYRDGMPKFAELLAMGSPPMDAFRQAFGSTMDQALTDLAAYLPGMHGASVAAPPAGSGEEAAVERITAVQATLARADLALHVSRRELARKLFEQAARNYPKSPQAEAGLGALALAEDRRNEARRQLARAIELGSRDAETFFELAMLEREQGGNRERVDELLEKVISLNPNFAEAHFLAGVRATDEGHYAAAIEHLHEAVRILPRQSYFWHALGYAQLKIGRRAEAIESARRAIVTSASEEETGMAEALLRQSQDNRDAVAQKHPAVITPPAWQNRKGDARIEGVLTRVNCDGTSARLVIAAADGRLVTLIVRNPKEVELVNAPDATYQFSCGAQQLRVAVEYVAADAVVTRIEFRRP